MKTNKLSALLLLIPLTACGGSDEVSPSELIGGPFTTAARGLVSQADAEEIAAAAAGGVAVASEPKMERGLAVLEVDVLRPSGTIIEVDVVRESGLIMEMEARHHQAGDDDLPLAEDFLSLPDALERAQAAEPGEAVEWELELDEAHQWRFEVRARPETGEDLREVELDARTAEVRRHGTELELEDPWDEHGHMDRMSTLPPQVRDAAGALLPGEIVEAEAEGEHGARVWKVTVRTASGAQVELRFTDTSARLYRAESERGGPFDYDLAPAGLVSLTQATSAAGITRENLTSWSLKRRSDAGLVWTFEAEGYEDTHVDAFTGQPSPR